MKVILRVPKTLKFLNSYRNENKTNLWVYDRSLLNDNCNTMYNLKTAVDQFKYFGKHFLLYIGNYLCNTSNDTAQNKKKTQSKYIGSYKKLGSPQFRLKINR